MRAIPLLLLLGACGSPWVQQNAPDNPSVRVEVDISERQLHVLRDGEVTRTYPIAVGQPSHPTPTGDYTIHQIDWNPDWTPPDSEWAEGEDHTPPGHPDNPMGRARIIYQMPYTIHGTDALDSLGEARSHGSIRMANPDVIELGRLLMDEGGAHRSQDWFDRVLGNPGEMVSVELPDPIPLTNR